LFTYHIECRRADPVKDLLFCFWSGSGSWQLSALAILQPDRDNKDQLNHVNFIKLLIHVPLKSGSLRKIQKLSKVLRIVGRYQESR